MDRIASWVSIAVWWLLLIAISFGTFAIIMITYAGGATRRPDPCLTKQQARVKYPGKWLYWHTEYRCWDANRRYQPKKWYVVIPLEKGDPIATAPLKQAAPFDPWKERVIKP